MIVPLSNNVESFKSNLLKDLLKAVDQYETRSQQKTKADTFRFLVEAVHRPAQHETDKLFQTVYKHFTFGFAIFCKPDDTLELLAAIGNPAYSIISDTGVADVLLVTMKLDDWVTFVLSMHTTKSLIEVARHLRAYFDQNGYSFLLWNTPTTK